MLHAEGYKDSLCLLQLFNDHFKSNKISLHIQIFSFETNLILVSNY